MKTTRTSGDIDRDEEILLAEQAQSSIVLVRHPQRAIARHHHTPWLIQLPLARPRDLSAHNTQPTAVRDAPRYHTMVEPVRHQQLPR